MKRKALRLGIVSALVLLIALTAGVVVSSAKVKGELPEYLGSKACLGCHVDKFENWEETGHAHMLTQVFKQSDLPGDIDTASEEIQAELNKAQWIVAGQRFLARDPKTGALSYLNVQWDSAKGEYVAYKGGSNWETGCAGCHTTGWDKTEAVFTEPGIGCESCHGPGRDHVLGKGDISKIVATDDAQTCGACHTGGAMPNGERWSDYKPGDDLHATGFLFPEVPDPHEALYPDPSKVKMRQYPLWEQSAHATAVLTLAGNDHASDRCYSCHAAEAFQNQLAGKTAPADHKQYEDAITCSACHDPHNSTNPGQLRMPEEQLCITCHNGSIPEGGSLKPGSAAHHPMKEMLEGYGAINIAPTEGAHSGLTCTDCHMTEGNHLMRVIKPSEVADTARKDTCTSCHTHADSSKESREVYLEMWQEAIGRRIEQVKGDVAVIDAVLKASPSALSADLKAKYDAAKTNMTFVDADASKGVHNFEYAIKIMAESQKTMAEVRKALGK